MKNHMKTTHECFIKKEPNSTFPLNFLVGSGGDLSTSLLQNSNTTIENSDAPPGVHQFTQQQQSNATMEYLRQQSAENSFQLQMINLNSALSSMQVPKLESLLPTTQ